MQRLEFIFDTIDEDRVLVRHRNIGFIFKDLKQSASLRERKKSNFKSTIQSSDPYRSTSENGIGFLSSNHDKSSESNKQSSEESSSHDRTSDFGCNVSTESKTLSLG